MNVLFFIYILIMANRSDLSGKGPRAGQKRSHSMHASKRWFKPNIIEKIVQLSEQGIRTIARIFFKELDAKAVQKMVDELTGEKFKLKMTAKEYKKLRKEGVL